ncbi:MAG: bifunctional phosphopantothenoylcysteine decarboxylase/phosphopantothenate--cysteine ligase CoaBC [Pseudomonadota bacterium]
MSMIDKPKILLGVTGGIAAYKSAELVRLLQKAGAEVRVVMTPSAREFVQPLTFQALSGHKVYSDTFDSEADSAMDHIELARWCDLMLVAPASADFLAKLNAGYSDNLLLTLCLANPNTLALAPAMNQQMYANPATQTNLEQIAERGVLLWGPDSGEQACGDVGPGRMLEPQQIASNVQSLFAPGQLEGVSVLLTAGPTREAIDPVRFISNRSSGKMGYALALAAQTAGAQVTLVSGPVALKAPTGIDVIPVESAQQMHDAVMGQIKNTDVFIACAAVADYRVEQSQSHKMKKSDQSLTLDLVPNRDILADVSALTERPFCVGFAAETRDLEKYARDKLQRKRLDMIAANLVSAEADVFESDRNQLEVFWPDGHQSLARASKNQIANELIDLVANRYTAQHS